MVEIRRPTRGGRFGDRGQSSGYLRAIRVFLIAMVVWQAWRMISNTMGATTPNSRASDAGATPLLNPGNIRGNQSPPKPHKEVDIKPKPTEKPPEPEQPKVAEEKPKPVEELEPEPAKQEPQVKEAPVEAVEIKKQEDTNEAKPAEKEVDSIPGAPIHSVVLDKSGTGPTNVAYVKDFIAERKNPEFRKAPINSDDASKSVADMVKEPSVTPCESLVDGKRKVNEKCLDSDTPQVAYNSAPFTRTWCGQEIKPGAAVTMTEHCSDHTVHLFSADKFPVDGKDMPPIIIKSHSEVELQDSDMHSLSCKVPCKLEKGIEGDVRYFEGEPWKMTQTGLSPTFYEGARIERTDFRRDVYYSNQSFKSSVPLTHYDFDLYSLRNRPPVDFDSVKNKAVYLVQKNCNSSGSRRHKYVAAVSAKYPVEAMGECQHNTDVPPGMTLDTPEGRIAVMKQYRFVLAFEPVTDKDHISPMIWEALVSGAVPVVVGADNLRQHVPPHSYINSGDFSNWDDLAEEVKRVSGDKEAWESFHKWRTDEAAIAAVEAKYEFVRSTGDPTCRLCSWAYAKKYGLGWDQVKQAVTENHVPRNFCISSSHSLISKPFQEEWVGRHDDDDHVLTAASGATDSCDASNNEGKLDVDSFKVSRSVIEHDGVVDLLVDSMESQYNDGESVLRLKFPTVQNTEGAHFVNSHSLVPDLVHGPLVSSASIQDDFTKITVLANWVTTLSSPMEGVLEVVVQASGEGPIDKDTPKRIRVITEDMSAIHDKLTEFFPSSYGKKMIKDFVDPLEIYFADS